MDTNKMRDISREQFEAVFNEKYPLTFAAAKAGESEAHGAVSIAWWGWQASREAVVIDLTQAKIPGGGYLEDQDAIAAIEAHGLKVAP
jgi:hypothetical protein